MQLLRAANNDRVAAADCARGLLATVPGLMRFIRSEMRLHRGGRLTVPQFRALILVSHQRDASLSDLADHVGLSLPAASRMVQLMVRRGLMERNADPGDRRRVRLAPTRRGRDAYRAALTAAEVALTRKLKTVSQAELSQIHRASKVLLRLFLPEDPRFGLLK